MKRRTFLKHLGIAAALPAVLNASGASNKDSKADPRSLRVLSCNIRVDVPADGLSGDGWEHRKDFCAEVIRSRNADLIGLQETQPVHFEYLKQRFPEFETYALFNPGRILNPSNAIFFLRERFELISAGGFWLSETPHVAGSKSWDSANSRFINWVELKDRRTARDFRFWNTHFDHIGHKARENAGAMVVQACQPLPKGFPQLLAGDLNAGLTHTAMRNLLDGGWVDTYAAIHGPEDPGFTAHGFKGVKAEPRRADGSLKQKIDWVLVRGPVKPLAASIIRDSRDGKYPSDHFFISADVELS
jgi:endonuclease/exonuclease/phosphatase family metal-dependent hydrolase